MLRFAADIWYPGLHKDIVTIAKFGHDCSRYGKNIKPLLSQSDIGKIPIPNEVYDAIALDFAGPFKVIGISKKNNLFVSVDHKAGWPVAMFLRKPNTEKGIFGFPKFICCTCSNLFVHASK